MAPSDTLASSQRSASELHQEGEIRLIALGDSADRVQFAPDPNDLTGLPGANRIRIFEEASRAGIESVGNRVRWIESCRLKALAGDDAGFLATHSQIEGFDVGGSRAAEVSSANEQGLFDAAFR